MFRLLSPPISGKQLEQVQLLIRNHRSNRAVVTIRPTHGTRVRTNFFKKAPKRIGLTGLVLINLMYFHHETAVDTDQVLRDFDPSVTVEFCLLSTKVSFCKKNITLFGIHSVFFSFLS